MVANNVRNHKGAYSKKLGIRLCQQKKNLNELVIYKVKFPKFKYDWLSSKLIEEHVEVSQLLPFM
jgi:hypothetical protein